MSLFPVDLSGLAAAKVPVFQEFAEIIKVVYIKIAAAKSQYSNTQFFTEKYMITTIVDAMDITSRKKLLDPACGGGNFLLYSVDSFCNQTTFPKNDKGKCIDILL